MMWKETVNANCSRDRRRAVRSIGIPSPVLSYPLGMGEHLEPVVARDADEGEAYRLCSANRQRRRRRYPNYDGRPYHSGFLHKLDGNSARQHNDALSSRLASAQQCARQFVERVVASDVFAENEAPTGVPKTPRRGPPGSAYSAAVSLALRPPPPRCPAGSPASRN